MRLSYSLYESYIMYLDSKTAHSGGFESSPFLLLTERRLGNEDTIFKNMGDTKRVQWIHNYQ